MDTLTIAIISIIVGISVLLMFRPLRRVLISKYIIKLAARAMPKMGDTERIALQAGTVGWDGELFSGSPDWDKLLKFKIKPLTGEELDFLGGPVDELCNMLDDWQIIQDRDLSPEIWAYIKDHGFLGMVIDKKYGGLGFSAHAHAKVVSKISSVSVTAAVTVMVPNSLGPGELLHHYGTEDQKNHYLPRLAKGIDIPCFALTEPTAGSDAANGQSEGIVCKDKKGHLAICLTFNKRYITLAPVATVIGLAFRLYDPDGLIGDVQDLGITCALLPRSTPGLIIGDRHDPMGIPFQNGPVKGANVVAPIDVIIGGQSGAGRGWHMLMEQLAAGRSVSLPAQAVAAAQLSVRATSAYAQVREQFGLPIGKFEGVREGLARIAGRTYFMNAARRFAFGAVDADEKPSVISAIVKAYLTEASRTCINDAMDIHAGSAICRGPSNIFNSPYNAIPIGITVEGANILTRSLMIFGLGAIRCHPYVQDEMDGIANNDLKKFDRAFFAHLAHITKNCARSFLLGLSGSRFAASPVTGVTARYFRELTRFSSVFALLADVAMGTLGGALKRKEFISGRFADALSWMFICSTTLKYFHDHGCPHNQKALMQWTVTHALKQIEDALLGILENLPNRFLAQLIQVLAFPFGARCRPVNDQQTDAATDILFSNDAIRDHLTMDIFIPPIDQSGLGQLDHALTLVKRAAPVRDKIDSAVRKGILKKENMMKMAETAAAKDIVSSDEFTTIVKAELIRDKIIQVSDFSAKTYSELK